MSDRAQAWGLLTEFTQSESLRKHALAVEACMRAYARKLCGGSPEKEDLWGVVGRPKASMPGFNYSDALKAKGGTWTPEDLYQFLANPKGYIPGTAMTFAGLPRDTQRADVINYLHTLADKPVDLPKAAAK